MTATATRSAVIALREERKAMREGCAFLDEKCLLLAAAILAQLRAREALERELAPLWAHAHGALRAALARHALEGLACQPALEAGSRRLVLHRRSLLGVPLVEAALEGVAGAAPPAANPSPEAHACREAYAALLAPLTRMAGIDSNILRLHAEYHRTVRRVRALEDVVLPEIERDCEEMEATLSEVERDEAVWARFGQSAARRAGTG